MPESRIPSCVYGYRWFNITVEASVVSLVCETAIGDLFVPGITVEVSAVLVTFKWVRLN